MVLKRTTTANKSSGFDPKAINLVLIIYARDIGKTRTIMMRKSYCFVTALFLLFLLPFYKIV